ncbi:MAG: beta-ketoacyl-[acyl-carrier-protein] synthase family protein [Brevibacterium sp.]|nr:beta-ketoacyl-[acyl-carrier-protein] synthase family protein [Brevibacterium sp.]MDN5833917.1 beta-ketoacyl-[acyl-carrier-protein] synthase family protein [Brevibacterium sp.]MDN5876543.1 beta-ketoacyl-[acyl-carrier-protein] synthase family protein [Brevibacterium sp.]MDN5910715.1 beta-ketoacyl-[acyl-carrier-protein] synthase family protein [Brevibacterium sp.]MDN6133967.1 beta-ketoacyl-[acyl-carrier-protein] synthase family protein [Brevibacterium sp.]
MGAITPSGNDVDSLWDSVVAGRSAIGRLEDEQFADLAVRIGGQVTDFDAEALLPRALARRLSPVQHWAISAAEQALAQAGIPTPTAEPKAGAGANSDVGGSEDLPWDRSRVAVIAATGSGPVDAMQAATRSLLEGGPRSVPLGLAIHGAPDSAAALLSQRFDFRGPGQGVSATCASGAIGLGEGMRRIRHGYADAVLVVGMEDCLNPVNLASNANMRALAAGYEDDPTSASRPFDRSRSGFVMSQGAAAILLESEAGAAARSATVCAELAGFGAASDAHHPTNPHPEGRGAASAVSEALADAGLVPGDIDHINAHATGTPAGDAAELAAFDASLGSVAHKIPISATKSSTGHLLGASGVVEAILTIRTLAHQTLPPTLNLGNSEFDGWDIVTGQARAVAREGVGRPLDTVLSTSFGFGGHNGAIVLRRPRALNPASKET